VIASGDALQRQVREVRVGAMNVEHFIEDLVDGTLVIVAGDRSDILVACLASTLSVAVPAVAGIILTGYPVGTAVADLLRAAPFAVLRSPLRTYQTAAAVHDVASRVDADSGRKIATALAVFEAGVDPAELAQRIALPRGARVTPMMFQYDLIERAKGRPRHIVLPEGGDDRVLTAADILLRREVVQLTILGQPDEVRARASALGCELDAARLVDPLTSPLRADYAATYQALRRHKGMTEEIAYDAVADPSYFGTLMVHSGAADGMVSGAAHTTADTIRPAFEIIKAAPGASVVSSVFFMCLADRVLVYGDCAVNPNPDADQLAAIAISSAATAESFGIEARVAMLSYSTGGSGSGTDVDTVRAATQTARQLAPELKIDGPIQYDAAVDANVAALKLPGSEVAGHATVFIFPNLDTGNVAYKAVQRAARAIAIGPVLQGLRKPVNDLSRGCSVVDIVNTVAITAIQAQAEPI
jgi:phosphate acetyltransferase